VRDNSFIIGSTPQPGIPDGMKFALSLRFLKHGLRWNGGQCIERAGDSKEESPISSLVGSVNGATLNTTFEEPKITLFWF